MAQLPSLAKGLFKKRRRGSALPAVAAAALPYPLAPQLELAVLDFPREVATAAAIKVPVMVTNRGATTVDVPPERAIYASYRWRRTGEQLPGNAAGAATMLEATLPPGASARLTVNVVTPKEPGDYILRVGLLVRDEGWLEDQSMPLAAADCPATVRQQDGWSDFQRSTPFSQPEFNNVWMARHLRTPAGRARPAAITCETIDICSHHCIICPYGTHQRARSTMPLDLWRKVLVDYASMGGGELSLTPSVGEVFLDKLLIERLRMLDEFPTIHTPVVTTNAVMARNWTDEELAEIVNRFRFLAVSVYGLDSTEYATMTKTNYYDDMLEQIQRLLRLKRDGEIKLGFRLLTERSADEVNTWAASHFAEAEAESGARLSVGPPNANFRNWSVLDTSVELPGAGKWLPLPDVRTPCILPMISLLVYQDGQVTFCPSVDFDQDEGLALGSVRENSLEELWNSPRARRLWDWATHGVPSFCSRCTCYIPADAVWEYPYLLNDQFDAVGA